MRYRERLDAGDDVRPHKRELMVRKLGAGITEGWCRLPIAVKVTYMSNRPPRAVFVDLLGC